MPIIAPRETTRPLNTPFQTDRGATPYNFGAGVGRATRELGRATSNLGGVISKIATQEQIRDYEINAKKLDNQFQESLNDYLYGENGFYSKRGENAVDAAPKLKEEIDKLKTNLSESAINPDAKRLFDNAANQRWNTERVNIDKYTIGQKEEAADKVTKSRIENAINDATLNFEDRNRFNSNLNIVRNEIIDIGMRKGWNPEVIQNEIAKQQSSLITDTVLAAIASHQLAEASRLTEEYQDKITKTEIAKLQNQYDAAQRTRLAEIDRQDARRDEKRREIQEENFSYVIGQAAQGILTETKLLGYLDTGAISTSQYENTLSFFRNEQDNIGNEELFLDYRSRILSGEGVQPSFTEGGDPISNTNLMQEIMNNLELSNDMKNKLITELGDSIQKGGIFSNADTKYYLKQIDEVIGAKSPLGGFANQLSANKANTAKEEFLSRVESGERPVDVYNDLKKAYSIQESTSLAALPKSSFWKGERIGSKKQLIDTFNKAYIAVMEEYESGEIDEATALREFNRLENDEAVINRMEGGQ